MLAVVAWAIGLGRLADNSFFTHLATGRLILDTGHVPRSDPYSYTADGASWVVQSWFPSVVYAQVEKLGHGAGLRLLVAASLAGLAAMAWRLAKPAQSLLPRLAVVGLFVGVGSGLWAERPFLFGLLALGATMLAVEGDLDPRWLIPIGWLWVNSHGSFPLGVVYVLVVLVGDRLDGEDLAAALRTLKWLVGGLLVGAINPLGPRLLWFPVELLGKQDALRYIGEWQAPRFTDTAQRLFLLQLAVGVVLIVRRPRYRSALLLALFVLAALVSARNITVASLVLVPVIARSMPEVGTLRSSDRPRLARVALAAVAACAVLVTSSTLRDPTFDVSGYPARTMDYLERHGVDRATTHLAHPDTVGNFLELRDGDQAHVFVDDRVDMYPQQVLDDNITLLSGDRNLGRMLDRYDIDLVLLTKDHAVAGRLGVDPAWKRQHADGDWLLFCRRGADLGGDLRSC